MPKVTLAPLGNQLRDGLPRQWFRIRLLTSIIQFVLLLACLGALVGWLLFDAHWATYVQSYLEFARYLTENVRLPFPWEQP